MATMNVGSGETSSQDDIAREVASAIADDNSGEQQSIQDVSQNINFVSSESGSFVRISTSSEDMAGPSVRPAVSSTGAVALNFGDEGSTLQDSERGSTSGGNGGVWGWISSAVGGDIVETTQRLGRNLVQKTKNSMDSVITTLDPGMEDYLHKAGANCINVLVTSTDEDIIEGVKDGFKQVFEHVFVRSQPSRSSLAPLPNSFSSALKSARQRITNLQSSSEVGVAVVAVEEFIAEMMPEMWFGMMCLCLHDASRKLETETFSQAFALPNDVVRRLEELTPNHYSLRWSGLSVSLAEVLQNNWTKFLTGVPKRQVVTLAAKALAGQYREKIQSSSSVMEKSITL